MTTCCFTGHRRIPPEVVAPLRERLEAEIESLIRQGVRYFGAGRRPGLRHPGGGSGAGLKGGIPVHPPDPRAALPGSDAGLGGGGREAVSGDPETGGQGGVYRRTLHQRLHVQAQPPSGRAQRLLPMLPDGKQRRHFLHGGPLPAAGHSRAQPGGTGPEIEQAAGEKISRRLFALFFTD